MPSLLIEVPVLAAFFEERSDPMAGIEDSVRPLGELVRCSIEMAIPRRLGVVCSLR